MVSIVILIGLLNIAEDGVPQVENVTKQFSAYGVVGIIRLLSGPYLILIKDRVLTATVQGHSVYKVTKVGVYPLNDLTSLPEKQVLYPPTLMYTHTQTYLVINSYTSVSMK